MGKPLQSELPSPIIPEIYHKKRMSLKHRYESSNIYKSKSIEEPLPSSMHYKDDNIPNGLPCTPSSYHSSNNSNNGNLFELETVNEIKEEKVNKMNVVYIPPIR